jgi:hypothetical protein
MNLDPSVPARSLALPGPTEATVFTPGEVTVFAVFNSTGNGHVPEQVVTGPHFQFGLTGPDDHGRDEQVRFASEGAGVVYSNRKIKDRWVLVSAWREQDSLAIELNGNEVGGPHPLDPPTTYGTDPAIGARSTGGEPDQPFQGFLGEVLVFNRNLEDSERHRITFSLMSKWFGWVMLDGSDEPRDLDWHVASSGLTPKEYRTQFVPRFGPDRNYVILGGAGHDILRGGHNDDILVGGRQSDTMTGGGGRDTFVFNHAHIHVGTDIITDFNPATDGDVLNIADLLRGDSRDLRDYLRLRTDGHDSYLDFDFAGLGAYTNHTLRLQSIVLRNEDLPDLWAQGNLITGDKRMPLTLSIAATTPLATEITATPAVFTIHFAGATVPADLEIPCELSGTAVRGVDYTLSVQRYNPATQLYDWEPIDEHEIFVHIKPGESDLGVRIDPIQNGRSQAARTVHLRLTAVPEWFDVSTATATAEIVDGPQRVAVVATDADASEAGKTGSFTLSRAGSLDVPLDASVTMTGPAVNGVDYDYIPSVVHFNAGQSAVVIPVAPYPDDSRELPEAVEMVLQPGAGYLVDSASQAATVVIQDSGPVITVEALEPLAVVRDAYPGAFLLRRQGMLNESLTVLFDITGTATLGVDYRRVNRFVTFGPGATTVLLAIAPIPGTTISGGAETVDLRILPDAAYAIGPKPGAQVRIVSAYRTFAEWQTIEFPGNTTPLPLFANQDFDGDGVPNGVEYAFGLDPKAGGAANAGLPQLTIRDARLGIRFTRPIAAQDVAYAIEISTNLVTWESANNSFEVLPGTLKTNGIEEVTVLDRQPLTAHPQRFVRIRPMLQ